MAALPWEDADAFAALLRRLPRDAAGNRQHGTVTTQQAHDNLLIAAAPYSLEVRGLRDLLVVVSGTGDVLIAAAGRAAEVAELGRAPFVNYLQALGKAPDLAAADAAGNQLQGACRVIDSSQCVAQAPPNASVTLLGVQQLRQTAQPLRIVLAPKQRDTPPGPPHLAAVQIYATPADGSRALAAQMVDDFRAALLRTARPAVVLSSGKTPLDLYAHFVAHYAQAIDWRRLRLLQMDEYSGLSADDPRLFRYFLRDTLVRPLGLTADYLSGSETPAEMLAHEQAIRQAGGIDVLMHGVGTNGHLGFNEPGTPADAPSRQVELAAPTRAAIVADDAAQDQPQRPVPTHAVTMGLGLLLSAKVIRVAAFGDKKAAAIGRGLGSPAGIDSPVSWVQRHPHASVTLDVAACPWLRR